MLGAHGAPRRSDSGRELLEYCKEGGLFALSTAYVQREACTWWHPRFRTGHQLDHFFTRSRDRWHVHTCRTLHFESVPEQGVSRRARRRQRRAGPRIRDDGVIAWAAYTDHHPVEIGLRLGGAWWKKGAKSTHNGTAGNNPNYPSMVGSSSRMTWRCSGSVAATSS